jgi:bifunctional non-homologous end joining protein LigD
MGLRSVMFRGRPVRAWPDVGKIGATHRGTAVACSGAVDTRTRTPAPSLEQLRPMLLGQTRRPFSDPQWAFEVKYDGYRALAEWGARGARLQSRAGTDMSRWFAEVTGALAALGGARCIVDGEICVLNELGIAGDAEFRRLFRRQARRGYQAGDDAVVFCVFDALVVRGRSVMARPLLERKAHLAPLLAGVPHTLVVGEIVGEGEALFEAALQLQLEGVVAKRLAAPYQPGARSRDWLKVKRPGAVPAERFRH